jgi:hypothetical protein
MDASPVTASETKPDRMIGAERANGERSGRLWLDEPPVMKNAMKDAMKDGRRDEMQ